MLPRVERGLPSYKPGKEHPMRKTQDESTLNAMVSRLAELEQAHARLQEQLLALQTSQETTQDQETIKSDTAAPDAPKQVDSEHLSPKGQSRRRVLQTGLGVAAAVGAGVAAGVNGGVAHAAPLAAGSFTSNTSGTPALKAQGTNGANGVGATSDSGVGIRAVSTTGLAGRFVGDVRMDNDLTITGTLSSGPGSLASSAAGTPALTAPRTNGANGMDAGSNNGVGVSSFSGNGTAVIGTSSTGDGVHGVSNSSGTGVSATSTSGTGLLATSSTGLAGHFVGNVSMDNALAVASTLNSGPGTFVGTGTALSGISATGDGVHGTSSGGVG